jgi:adenylate cyclase
LAAQRVERMLAAILAADLPRRGRLVAGEVDPLEQLTAHRRKLIDRKIAGHKGRILGSSPRTKTAGDNMPVEFPSVVDAIRCAIEGQRAIVACNAENPEDQRIAFGIGVNLGDPIVDGDDIYGDGVNITVCLHGFTEPGGICISRVVRDQRSATSSPTSCRTAASIALRTSRGRCAPTRWGDCHRVAAGGLGPGRRGINVP